MNILLVVAHPDDEALGAGATIHKLVQDGHKVAVATLVNEASARAHLSPTLFEDQKRAFEIMGVHKSYPGSFPNIQMNTVPHLQLVQFIEAAIEDWKAESIYTHHPSDTNNDHVMTSYAVQAASRLFQRKGRDTRVEAKRQQRDNRDESYISSQMIRIENCDELAESLQRTAVNAA